MSDKLETIAEIIQDTGSFGVMGEDIFIGHFPVGHSGVLLREPYGGVNIDYNMQPRRITYFVLAVREKTHSKAKQKIEGVIKAIETNSRVTKNSITFEYIRPQTEPEHFPVSPGGNVEFECQIDILYHL